MAITEEQDRVRRDTDGRANRLEERTHRRRWAILAILSVSLLVIIVDDTIVNVAIPTLQRELGASTTALQWIVDAPTSWPSQGSCSRWARSATCSGASGSYSSGWWSSERPACSARTPRRRRS